MEIKDIEKKIDDIKTALDAAFEKGEIDFDRITGDLDTIKRDIQTFVPIDSINRAILSRRQQPACPGTVQAGDYR